LNSEYIARRAVVSLRPKILAIHSVDKFGAYAETVALSAHTPFEHIANIETASDLARVEVLALEGRGGGPRRDPQSADLGERVDQFLGHAIREVVATRVRADVHEREHCYRALDRFRGGR
jgi:hypothetical protein